MSDYDKGIRDEWLSYAAEHGHDPDDHVAEMRGMFGIIHTLPISGYPRDLYAHNFRSRAEAESYIRERISSALNPIVVPLPNYKGE
jgi:hypothetical protein